MTAFAFDGVTGVTDITEGRVTEAGGLGTGYLQGRVVWRLYRETWNVEWREAWSINGRANGKLILNLSFCGWAWLFLLSGHDRM